LVCSANSLSSSFVRLSPWDCNNSSTLSLLTSSSSALLASLTLSWRPFSCRLLASSLIAVWSHFIPVCSDIIYWSHFIPVCSDIIYGSNNVVVLPKYPDGLFIFNIFMSCLNV
jgi:hypothetical protein